MACETCSIYLSGPLAVIAVETQEIMSPMVDRLEGRAIPDLIVCKRELYLISTYLHKLLE